MKKQPVLIVILSVLVIGTSAFSYKLYKERKNFKNYLVNQYQKNLYELITHVNSIEVSLSKALVASSEKQNSVLFGNIWQEAKFAHDKLNSLPIAQSSISNTSKFLSQVSDFSYAMLNSKKSSNELSDKEFNNIQKLKDYSGYLAVQLKSFVNQYGNKGIDLKDIKNQGSNYLRNTQENINVAFQDMSEQIQQYPSLIYDGPFSENVLNIKPRVLEENVISITDAKKIVEKIEGNARIDKIEQYKTENKESIPAYSLGVKLKGRNVSDINIDISKNGGHIIYLLDARNINNLKLNINQAAEKGLNFLKSIGYDKMVPTYSLKYDGIVIINYVDTMNKILMYPDQIKLKIALDNGEIVGVEGQHFLIAHHIRNLESPQISLLQAKKSINQRLIIKRTRLALIPMESLREVLCYEFYGEYNGERYFVYVNVKNGTEERILKIINTENGELTM
jgi:spore germination protein